MVKKRSTRTKRGTPAAGRSARPPAQIKKTLAVALRRAFPHDTVDISDGYQSNIHVLVVSRAFDALEEQQKQEYLWKLIDATNLSEEEKQLISLVLPLSPDDVK
ncbi:MAG TPA: hypothetical protein PKK06_15895 [Phycisphaerae bacterium]|nr:hypothetical protein [Phycisphaerae bacterium]HNU47033.1 hypothetical protein [Phycisphaerae bacterium]